MKFRLVVRKAALMSLVWLSFAPIETEGCDVPVFRYALERWTASPFDAVVVHRGALTPEQRELVETMRAAAGDRKANLRVREAYLEAGAEGLSESIVREAAEKTLPRIVLMPPEENPTAEVLWSGELIRENFEAIVDSPARREIADRLVQGDTSVWVVLESGNAEADAAAKSRLEGSLRQMETELKDAGAGADGPGGIFGPPPIPIRFSSLSISRTDPGESALTAMLMGSEPDLPEYVSHPMAFPIFGRGRVLYALVGKGINKDTVAAACRFVAGPCSCEAKALNPGSDLLMAMDWDAEVEKTVTEAALNPPLVALSTLAEAAGEPEPPEVEQAGAVHGSDPPGDESPGALRVGPPVKAAGHLVRNMAVTLAVLLGAVALVTLRLLRQSSKERP